MVILQMAFAFYGYGMSKLPYILYPYIKISDSGVNSSMGLALTIVFILGFTFITSIVNIVIEIIRFDKQYVEGKSNLN